MWGLWGRGPPVEESDQGPLSSFQIRFQEAVFVQRPFWKREGGCGRVLYSQVAAYPGLGVTQGSHLLSPEDFA